MVYTTGIFNTTSMSTGMKKFGKFIPGNSSSHTKEPVVAPKKKKPAKKKAKK